MSSAERLNLEISPFGGTVQLPRHVIVSLNHIPNDQVGVRVQVSFAFGPTGTRPSRKGAGLIVLEV